MATLASPLPLWCTDQRLSNAGGRDRSALWFLGLLGMSVRLPYGCEQAPRRNNYYVFKNLLCLAVSEILQYIVLGPTDFRSEVGQHNMTAGEPDRGCIQDKRLPIDMASVVYFFQRVHIYSFHNLQKPSHRLGTNPSIREPLALDIQA